MPELHRAAAARADCHFPLLLTKYHPLAATWPYRGRCYECVRRGHVAAACDNGDSGKGTLQRSEPVVHQHTPTRPSISPVLLGGTAPQLRQPAPSGGKLAAPKCGGHGDLPFVFHLGQVQGRHWSGAAACRRTLWLRTPVQIGRRSRDEVNSYQVINSCVSVTLFLAVREICSSRAESGAISQKALPLNGPPRLPSE